MDPVNAYIPFKKPWKGEKESKDKDGGCNVLHFQPSDEEIERLAHCHVPKTIEFKFKIAVKKISRKVSYGNLGGTFKLSNFQFL